MTSNTIHVAFWNHIGYILAAAASIVCYWNSLHGTFVHDDLRAIVGNNDIRPDVTSLGDLIQHDFWGNSILSERSHKSYRPLCVLTFRLNFMMSGLEPFSFHVTNVILHTMTSLAFLYFCRRIVRFDRTQATVAAIWFAVHPIHTEAVANVVGRADILAGLFLLLAVIVYDRCRSCANGDNARGTIVWSTLLLSLLLATIATFCKETGIVTFAVCLLLDSVDIWRHYLLGLKYSRIFNVNIRACIIRFVLTLAATMSTLLIRMRVMDWTLPRFNVEDNPAAFHPKAIVRLLSYANLFHNNLLLILNPSVLSYDWQMSSIPLILSPFDLRTFTSFASLTAVVSLLIYCGRCHLSTNKAGSIFSLTPVSVGLSLTLFPLLLTSNLLFTVGFVIAERTLYIASMGVIMLTMHGAKKLSDRFCERRRRHLLQTVGRLLFVLLILSHGCRTVVRNNVWKDRENLFRSGLLSTPQNAKVHYNYANVLADRHEVSKAIHHYRLAITLWPSYASALNNLGVALNDSVQSELLYRQAIFHQKCHANAHFNLGNLLRTLGRLDEAITCLNRAIQCDPFSSQPHSSLAVIYRTLNNIELADRHYQTAIELNQHRPQLRANYASFLYELGDLDGATAQLSRSVELQTPSAVLFDASLTTTEHVRAQTTLHNHNVTAQTSDYHASFQRLLTAGQLSETTGRIARAIELYTTAVRLQPLATETWLRLANSLRNHTNHDDVIVPLLMNNVHTGSDRLDVVLHLSNYYGSQQLHYKAITLLSTCLTKKVFTNATQLGAVHLQLAKHLHDQQYQEEAVKRHAQLLQQMSTTVQCLSSVNHAPNRLDFCPEVRTHVNDVTELLRLRHCLLAVKLRPELAEAHHRLAIYLHMQSIASLIITKNRESERHGGNDGMAITVTNNRLQHFFNELEGKFEFARVHYNIAQRLSPKDRLIRENMEKLERTVTSSESQTTSGFLSQTSRHLCHQDTSTPCREYSAKNPETIVSATVKHYRYGSENNKKSALPNSDGQSNYNRDNNGGLITELDTSNSMKQLNNYIARKV